MGGYPWLKERSKPSETLTKTKMEIEPNQRHLAFRHSPAPVLTTHSKHYAIWLWPSFTPDKLLRHASHTQYTLATADSIQGNPAPEEGATSPEPGEYQAGAMCQCQARTLCPA